MRTRSLVNALLIGALTLTSSPVALAGTETTGERTHKGTETFVDILFCADGGYLEITAQFEGVWRENHGRNGSHFTFTETGKFTASPVTVTAWEQIQHDDHFHDVPVAWEPRDGVSYSGGYTVWGGFNANDNGAAAGTFTFRANAKGSDGSRLNEKLVEHVTAGPGWQDDFDAAVRNAFFKLRCH